MNASTSSVLESVLADLTTEGDRLETLVAGLDEAGWRSPTPAAGWDIATQIAHLAWTDEVSVLAATDKQAWDALVLEAIEDPLGFVDRQALVGGAVPPEDLLARWVSARADLVSTLRDYPAGEKVPWFGPAMSPPSMATARLMETWAHSQDVHEALGVEPEVSDRIRHIAHLGVRTRDFAFASRERTPPAEEFRVELTSPSGQQWSWGAHGARQTVTGSALDFCLVVTQRRHRDDTDLIARGADAELWLTIAQAFAGPPGPGRPPRG